MFLVIKNLIKSHKWAIVLAIVVGLLMILPQILFIIQTSSNYSGVNILATDSESTFLSVFQEASEGDWNFSDIFLTSNRSEFYQNPYLGELFMYKFGRLFFLNVGQNFLLTKFILPAILFLMIYFFVFLFDRNKNVALSSSIGVMLWYGISSIPEFKSFWTNNLVISSPSVFSRPVTPAFGMIILFSFLSFFYLYIIQSKKKYYWLSGILFGFSFYVYFFTWSFLTVFVSVSIFWFLVKKDRLNLKKILKIVFLGALITLPYWFNFYKLIHHEIYSSLASQQGLIFSNSIIIGKYLFIALILCFFNIYTKTIKKENLWLWLCLTISFVIVLNQQLITRRILQPGHYHWYIIKPLTIILFIWFISNLFQNKYKKYFGLLVFFIMAGGFYLLIGQQIFTYRKSKENTSLRSQRYSPVYRWLNQNTEKNQFIFSGIQTNSQRLLLSCYTHLDEYLYRNKVLHPGSFSQNKFILFLEYRLDKISPETAKKLFFTDLKDEIFYQIYGYYYRITYLDKGESVSKQEVQTILNEYIDFYDKDLKTEFRKYPINYIIWDKQLNPQWNLDNFDFLQFIYEVNDVRVYRLL